MTYTELLISFNSTPISLDLRNRSLWFEKPWVNPSLCANDILIAYLRENGYEYIRTFTGTVWFLYRGEWCRCDHEVKEGFIRFYLLEYYQ